MGMIEIMSYWSKGTNIYTVQAKCYLVYYFYVVKASINQSLKTFAFGYDIAIHGMTMFPL